MVSLVNLIIPLGELIDTKYGRAICYPKYSVETLEERVDEMRRVGVKAICFCGEKVVAGVPVLGKGYVGIVVMAILEDERRVALKIARTDVKPGRLIHEAEMLQKANSVNVGPKILGHTSNLLIMEYIDGILLPKWVYGLSGDRESASLRLKAALRDILEQCWRLDSIGLDHGELSWADKHIIINSFDRAHILDFEAASDRRRTSNVTSISQYLFIKSRVAEAIALRIKRVDVERLLRALKEYKIEPSRRSFENILEVISLLS